MAWSGCQKRRARGLAAGRRRPEEAVVGDIGQIEVGMDGNPDGPVADRDRGEDVEALIKRLVLETIEQVRQRLARELGQRR